MSSTTRPSIAPFHPQLPGRVSVTLSPLYTVTPAHSTGAIDQAHPVGQAADVVGVGQRVLGELAVTQ